MLNVSEPAKATITLFYLSFFNFNFDCSLVHLSTQEFVYLLYGGKHPTKGGGRPLEERLYIQHIISLHTYVIHLS